jgi:hypothetical protein
VGADDTKVPEPNGEEAHNMTIVNAKAPKNADGSPRFADVWRGARPPFRLEGLSILPDGRVVIENLPTIEVSPSGQSTPLDVTPELR